MVELPMAGEHLVCSLEFEWARCTRQDVALECGWQSCCTAAEQDCVDAGGQLFFFLRRQVAPHSLAFQESSFGHRGQVTPDGGRPDAPEGLDVLGERRGASER